MIVIIAKTFFMAIENVIIMGLDTECFFPVNSFDLYFQSSNLKHEVNVDKSLVIIAILYGYRTGYN